MKISHVRISPVLMRIPSPDSVWQLNIDYPQLALEVPFLTVTVVLCNVAPVYHDNYRVRKLRYGLGRIHRTCTVRIHHPREKIEGKPMRMCSSSLCQKGWDPLAPFRLL